MVSRSYGLGSLLFPGLPGFMHGVAAHLPAVEPPGPLLTQDTPRTCTRTTMDCRIMIFYFIRRDLFNADQELILPV